MTLREIFWHQIPPTRVGVFSGRIHCPCEVQFWDAVEPYFVPAHEPQKVLVDLGCGPGVKALTLALSGFRVIGFDIRASAIQHARENLRQTRDMHPQRTIQAEFFQKDLQQGLSELEDASVDRVLFVEVIEHIDAHEHVLQEIERIIKPDGLVIITAPNKRWQRHVIEDGEQVYGEHAYDHVRDFDIEELSAVIRQAGLEIVSQGYFNPARSDRFCRFIHPWMIRDHGFLQGKAGIQDVIGIRTLGFLQPVYNALFPAISWGISAYNRFLFPRLYRLTATSSLSEHGKNLFIVSTKAPGEQHLSP